MENYKQFLHVFTRVSRSIHSGDNTNDILDSIVSNIAEILQAKGCIFWIVDRGQEKIKNKISHGFSYRSLVEIQYETLMQIFDQQEENFVFIEDAMYDPRIPNLDRIGKKRVSSISAFNFDIVREIKGILAVYFTKPRILTSSEMDIVRALGEQGAIALQKKLSFDEKILNNLRQMVEGFTLALEAKDEQTHGHSQKVARFAKLIAEKMDLSDGQVETVYHGGLLHDIGKIGMNDHILERLGILNRREMDIIKQHPIIGARITKPLVFLSDIEPLILYHHERYDGTGYPDGLKGKNIPLGARIITVCDAFETMLAGRKHFSRMKIEDAVVNLREGAGSQFDPEVVESLLSILEEDPALVGADGNLSTYIGLQKRNMQNNKRNNMSSLFI